MALPQIYLYFHVLFMIGIIVLCMLAAMPTRYWMGVSAWGRQYLLRKRGDKLKKALALQGENFLSDESFLDRGVGLAIDKGKGLIFLAQKEGQRYKTAILPKSQLGTHETIIRQEDGFQRCFLEISQIGPSAHKWLLPCMDSDLADEINSRLNEAL